MLDYPLPQKVKGIAKRSFRGDVQGGSVEAKKPTLLGRLQIRLGRGVGGGGGGEEEL